MRNNDLNLRSLFEAVRQPLAFTVEQQLLIPLNDQPIEAAIAQQAHFGRQRRDQPLRAPLRNNGLSLSPFIEAMR